VSKVVLDEDAERIEVVVPDEQLSLAIGRRGQNVRLASQLTGWDYRHHDRAGRERASPEGVQRAHRAVHERPQRRRGVGQLLATEGFATVEELAFVDRDEIAAIEGFDEETAEEAGDLILQARMVLGWIEPDAEPEGEEAAGEGGLDGGEPKAGEGPSEMKH
jgi:transcription termination/antitermination protein NusA